MAAHALASTHADKSTRFEWMWKSNANPWSKSEPEQWIKYSDTDNNTIEEAYIAKRSQAVLNGYCIDFRHRVQIADNDSNKQRPIKRVECN
jgi:hypothetical protein